MTEPSGSNGTRTDHDRDQASNGANGVNEMASQHGAPAKETAVPVASSTALGQDEPRRNESDDIEAADRTSKQTRMNDLPGAIVHITQGFVPLSLLLTRLAQTTHNVLEDKIAELAKMPVPVPATVANGHSSYSSSGPDDSSTENLRKKGSLLQFAQEWHGKWLKALVIADWSRNSPLVSKLIDLKFHLDQQRMLYDGAVDNMINVKRDLTFARMPSPDLKTALQVLSTGSAPWMPDLQYIDPPPLTHEAHVKWISELNTLLSLRLNLDDFDKIPPQFRNYEIGSGCVTFKVEDEFEVDLTIADEDFQKQFWFIDFRYAFTKAASSLPEALRNYLEGCVNDVLGREGLQGCFQFLHEFVLTSKVTELKRQALQLSRTSWTGTLNVEPLNRALAIQYWKSRSSATGPKSWILIGINSNRQVNGKHGTTAQSQIVAKWYRDGREVVEAGIELNVRPLSADALLRSVIARHIEHILGTIHRRLLSAALYKHHGAGMALQISQTDPAYSVLTIQVGSNDKMYLLLEPMTGSFMVKPLSKWSSQPEHQLNSGKNISPEDVVGSLENLRCAMLDDELKRQSTAVGWRVRKAEMTAEELRSVIKTREWTRAVWLQKIGWDPHWFVVVVLGLGGDEWWLLESANFAGSRAPRFQIKIAVHNGLVGPSDCTFWNNLAFDTTGLISQSLDLRELHRHEIKSKLSIKEGTLSLQHMSLLCVEVALSSLFPAMVVNSDKDGSDGSDGSVGPWSEGDGPCDKDMELLSLVLRASGRALVSKRAWAWAEDMVSVSFTGLQTIFKARAAADEDVDGETELVCASEAIVRVRRPAKFASLTGLVDGDLSFDPQHGEFSLRIQRAVGRPILELLKSRIKAIDRFVNYLEAMEGAEDTIKTESATLRQIAFFYGGRAVDGVEGEEAVNKVKKEEEEEEEEGKGTGQTKPAQEPNKRWRVVLDLSQDDIDVHVEENSPHVRALDLMRRLVNRDGGIGALISWLPSSLPTLEAVDRIASHWEPIAAARQGAFAYTIKTVGWMTMSYLLRRKPGVATDGAGPRRVSLQVRMKPHRNEPWWHAWRSKAGDAKSGHDDDGDEGDDDDDDDISKALQSVWDGHGQDWTGLVKGATGRAPTGVAAMLLAIDEAVRTCVTAAAEFPSTGNSHGQDVVVLD